MPESVSWSPQPKDLETRIISWAEIHELFLDISDEFGYTAENYSEELADLITIWTNQGFVEIYQERKDRKYGRVKDSSLAPRAVPYYIGLFHVRVVDGDNDPLAVLVFEDRVGDNGEVIHVASLRFMLDHDEMFGAKDKNEKFDHDFMLALRKRIDAFVQKGTEYNDEGAA